MTLPTHCEDRKQLVQTLSEFLGIEAEYLRTPTYAYRIGDLTVNRDGSITGDLEALAAIQQPLTEHGYIDLDAIEEPKSIEGEEDLEAQNDDTEPDDNYPGGINISIPLETMAPATLMNTLRMLYVRQDLIAAMTQCDAIAIDEELITLLDDAKPTTLEQISELLANEVGIGMVKGACMEDGNLKLSTRFPRDNVPFANAYATLLGSIPDRCSKMHRVNTKRIQPQPEEMKYFCNSWLMHLGFGGAEHKEVRAALLGHLKGYAAFRTSAGMDAHKAKYAAKRKALKESEENANDEN